MRRVVKAARLLRPIRNLHDDRNMLLQQVASLEVELATARRRLDELELAHTQGRLLELDYPYYPRKRDWRCLPGGNPFDAILAERETAYRTRLQSFQPFRDNFRRIAVKAPDDGSVPFWDNGWFPPLDAICLYGLVASTNPRLYLEVGSGNSTKFVRRAIEDHKLRTKIISIDPQPRAVVDQLCDEVVRHSFENVHSEMFLDLSAGDTMFVDNSHRSFQNSDVTVFFIEVVPKLAPGVIWGVHDIFLPNDYPTEWHGRFYNEQYLLMCYLLGGAGGHSIELPVAFVQERADILRELGSVLNDKPWGDVPLIGGGFSGCP